MPHPSPRHTRADEPRCDRVPGVYPGVLSRAIPRARHGAVVASALVRSIPHPRETSPRRPPRARLGIYRTRRPMHTTHRTPARPPPHNISRSRDGPRGPLRSRERETDDAHHPALAARGVYRAPLAGSPACALFRAPHTAPWRPRTPRCTSREPALKIWGGEARTFGQFRKNPKGPFLCHVNKESKMTRKNPTNTFPLTPTLSSPSLCLSAPPR